jgi:hypothetical protein
MKGLLVLAAAALCALAAGASVAAAPRVACTNPPASYRTHPAKVGIWAGACIACKRIGPRQLARAAHLSSSAPRTVARKYAERYANLATSQPIIRAAGGKAAAKALVQAGCLAGFRARGRP